MDREFYEFICKTINEVTGIEQKYDTKTDLTTYEINSLSFIKIIIAIENKYDFEFDDDYYTLDKMSTINAIYLVTQKYVKELK
jgi:acyl carrier protein